MKWLGLVILSVFLGGCSAGMFQPTGACVEGESVILAYTNNDPTGLNSAFLTTNFLALERGHYSKEAVEEFFYALEVRIRQGISYLNLLGYVNDSIERVPRYAGVASVILGTELPNMANAGGVNVLSSCDKELLLAHIANQRRLLVYY